MGKGGISGTGVAATALSAILLWSAIKGRNWASVVHELIKGSAPGSTPDYPINIGDVGSNVAGAAGATGTGAGHQVCASEFGGPNDPGTGSHGYKGDNLHGTMAFAELRLGTALGGLKYRQQVRITYKGRSVVATKLDIGAGGAGCGGHSRDIDLWYETAQALGFNGLDVVTVEIL